MKVFGGIFPFFVEIITTNVGAIISMDYTIRINHGHDLENKVLTQFFCFLISGQKKLQNAITYIRTNTLSRMNPSSNNNIPLLNLLKRMLFSNRQQLNIIPRNSFAQRRSLTNSPQIRICFNLSNIRLQITKRIGVGVCKVYLIIVIRKCVFPGQSVIGFVL